MAYVSTYVFQYSSFVCMLSFHHEQQRAHTFPLHYHLVETGTHALQLLHSPTARKNSCSLKVGTTCVMKLAISRLLSEIQRSSCACSIGNESRNTLVFSFFRFDALHACTAYRLDNSVSPFVSY